MKIIKSRRVDLLFCLAIGLSIPIYFGGIGHNKYDILSKNIDATYVLTVLVSIIFFGFALILNVFLTSFHNKDSARPLFISDAEIKNPDDDLLDLNDKALQFSERLYNGGSRESVVFGIDAPWGIGKSSFLNFCIKYLQEEHPEKIIIYRFDPLKHVDQTILQEKFISGLVKSIQEVVYIPEISSLMSRYSKILKGKVGFRMFGLTFEPSYGVDEAFEDLEFSLEGLNKKVIIIIDDLDRLDFGSVKEILFSIKKSFSLPNLSYVLCYDTENLSDLEGAPEDKEKVREFLEKFVNIKLGIFISSSSLANYISENFSKVLTNNKQIDPLAVNKLTSAIESIKHIYNSRNFYEYRPFLNDIRKLKRLVNLIISLDIESTDFENVDINKLDLIHLLLIYINYPSVFRMIYDTEMGESSGFFSLISIYDEGFDKDAASQKKIYNSIAFKKYIAEISDGQKFLICKIFDASNRFNDLPNEEPDQRAKHTFACFNGRGGGKNLQLYLNLISNSSKPKTAEQYTFYERMNYMFRGGKDIADIFLENEFLNNAKKIKEFWQILVNGAAELSADRANVAIEYLIESLPSLSFVEKDDTHIGIRSHLCRYIVVMLDRVGWSGKSGNRSNNSDKNISQIADWIFGENGKVSILQRLASKDRGVLGLYDVLLFRLQCSMDRDSSLFNISRALSLHSVPPAIVSGEVGLVAIGQMREISQYIYAIFRQRYIDDEINFFALVDDLDNEDLFSKIIPDSNSKVVSENDDENFVKLKPLFESAKSQIKSFCIYQLGNSLVNHGVGCGYYDINGLENKSEIKSDLNYYLFDVCFNPDRKSCGYKYFLEYLLNSFDRIFSFEHDDDFLYRPTLESFSKVLLKEKLSLYWIKNREMILDHGASFLGCEIHTSSYSITYEKGLPLVYKVLDELIEFNDTRDNITEIYG